jgi:Na+/H+-translocating membrane pyrophosphatase
LLLVRLLVAADEGLREFFALSFLGTAVSGLIVVGLILGSVVLSMVLLVQVRALYSCLSAF